ncbi:conserved hypothetical protein [Rhodospirillaceae bacterium LM-1]|nr:conserved hypothetical protein [Rhodospirillaceae bacterium LM-1]
MAQGSIEGLIRKHGPIDLERFMALAVQNYYAQGAAFGREGDFTTAPEISQIFGELIGAWCCLIWESLGSPAYFHLVELGPGRGALMTDLLRAAQMMPGFQKAARLHLVETSPALRVLQAKALDGYAPQWHDRFESIPNDAPMILVANEFLDALPIRQYVRHQDGWRERLIGLDERGKLAWQTKPEPDPNLALPPHMAEAADGNIAETCPQALALVKALADRLGQCGGAALFFDYGPMESGLGDSLQAVKGHAFAEVLQDPGGADLTAHVDFAALARQAVAQGVKAWGPVPQGVWLQRMGILERTRQLSAQADDRQRDLLISGTRRLIDPQEMGTLFKVLALTQPAVSAPTGFEVT